MILFFSQVILIDLVWLADKAPLKAWLADKAPLKAWLADKSPIKSRQRDPLKPTAV